MRRLPTLALVLIAAACVSRGPAVPSAPAADPEELVWAAVLQTFVTDSTERVIVRDSTLTFPLDDRDLVDLPRRLPGSRVELARSFVASNASRRALPDFDAVGVPVARVGEADLAFLQAAGDPNAYWREFYRAYPRSPGLIRLSRVGFDPERQQALVFVSRHCGGRCGGGFYLLLSSAGGSWVVTGKSGEYVL